MSRVLTIPLLTGISVLMMSSVAWAFIPDDPQFYCEQTKGAWNECGSGCGPATCDNPDPEQGGICPAVCVPLCECPAEAPLWKELVGCIAEEECAGSGEAEEPMPPGMALCEAEGGTWDWCGSGCGPYTCDYLPPSDPSEEMDCPTVCVEQCACPDDAPLWDDELGCLSESECGGGAGAPPINPNEVTCALYGGNWNTCGSGCGPVTCENPPPGEDDEPMICPEICVPLCECPGDIPYWDEVTGCHDGTMCMGGSPQEGLCAETGGAWQECGSGCGPYTCDTLPPADPNEPVACPAVCVEQCACPEDAPLWHETKGCIAQSECPVDDPDSDQDGYPASEECDDDNAGVYPGATELCNAIDDDCDGEVDEGCPNAAEQALCGDTGGEWSECASPCPLGCESLDESLGVDCPAMCVLGCVCPADAPIWDADKGCIPESECATEPEPEDNTEALCEATGGQMNECMSGCAPYSCDNPPQEVEDCLAVCVYGCECPEDAPLWSDETGCFALSACGDGSEDGSGAGAGDGSGSGEGSGAGAGTGSSSTEAGSGTGPSPEVSEDEGGGCAAGQSVAWPLWAALFSLAWVARRRLALES